VFFAILDCDAHFKSELRRNGHQHIKFLALTVDFSSFNFGALNLRSPPYGSVKYGYFSSSVCFSGCLFASGREFDLLQQ